MELGKKFFGEIDLFDFTSFFGWTFFNFLAHCEETLPCTPKMEQAYIRNSKKAAGAQLEFEACMSM